MKRLTFAFVIVLSLFVLGGCDKLLEGFFPEDTDSGEFYDGDADYSVAVSIEYNFDLIAQGFGPGNTGGIYSPIVAAFIPFYDSYDGGYEIDRNGIQYVTLWQNTFREDSDMQDSRTTVEFDTWNYSTYKVLVWFDDYPDTDPGIDVAPVEPGTLAIRNDTGEYWVDFRSMNPQNAGIQMSCRVGATSVINVQQLTADPYADYGTGGMAPYASIYNDVGSSIAQSAQTYFYGYNSYDPDGWINEWNWTIKDQYNSVIATWSGPDFPFTFTTIGSYYISLVVTDNQGVQSPEQLFSVYVYANSGGTEVSYDNTFGVLTVNGIQDYTFNADAPGQYLIYWEDSFQNSGSFTYTADVGVAIPAYFPEYTDSGYLTPLSIYVEYAQTITVRVNPIWATGTCTLWVNRIQ